MTYFPTSEGYSRGVLRNFVENNFESDVSLTSSGCYISPYYCPHQLLSYNEPYISEENPDLGQWLQMELKNHILDLEGYSLYSQPTGDSARNWMFSVSSNGLNWTNIHAKYNQNIVGGVIYSCISQGVRFFRWTCTAPVQNWFYMNIGQLDVFGSLFPYAPIDTSPGSCANSFITIFRDVNSLSLLFYSLTFLVQ